MFRMGVWSGSIRISEVLLYLYCKVITTLRGSNSIQIDLVSNHNTFSIRLFFATAIYKTESESSYEYILAIKQDECSSTTQKV